MTKTVFECFSGSNPACDLTYGAERVGVFYCKLCRAKSAPHGKQSCGRKSNYRKTVGGVKV